MPPVVALWITIGFIFFLFWRDYRQNTNIRGALWIPFIWLFLTGSRFASQWLAIFGISLGGAPADDGSPLDAAVFLALILAGLAVLKRRRVNLREFVRNNRWLTIFLLYCLISVVWSDLPLLSLKRWIKVLGHPVMALVVLTEPDPQEAVRRLFKTIAYVLIPLSICFIKYFPQIADYYDTWTGQAYFCGVALDKNQLGALCMNSGIFYFWDTLQVLRMKNRKARRSELFLNVGFLAMIWWLISHASSATSLTAMIVGISTIWILGLPFINRRNVATYTVLVVIGYIVAEPILGIYSTIVHLLGRNVGLTGRTDLWGEVLKLQSNPILGTGFENFWTGERAAKIWAEFPWHPRQVHDGYLEIYLNLGFVGIALLAGQIIGTFGKIRKDLIARFEFGRFRLAYLFAVVVYNYTEAAFVSTAFVWTMFFLVAVDYPIRRSRLRRSSERTGSELNGAVNPTAVSTPPESSVRSFCPV